MEDILVPLSFFALIFGIVYLGNRERMAMIEKGLDPRANRKLRTSTVLKWGLLLIGSGIGLFAAYLLNAYVFTFQLTGVESDFSKAVLNPVWVYFSLIAIGGGLGLFLSYLVERKDNKEKRDEG